MEIDKVVPVAGEREDEARKGWDSADFLLFSVSEYTGYQANQAILDPTPQLLYGYKKGHF